MGAQKLGLRIKKRGGALNIGKEEGRGFTEQLDVESERTNGNKFDEAHPPDYAREGPPASVLIFGKKRDGGVNGTPSIQMKGRHQ